MNDKEVQRIYEEAAKAWGVRSPFIAAPQADTLALVGEVQRLKNVLKQVFEVSEHWPDYQQYIKTEILNE